MRGYKHIDNPLSETRPTTSAEGGPLRIGRYIIERRLGDGGMGIVDAARDDRLQRTIAVKTLSSLADDDSAGGCQRQSPERPPDLRGRRG